LKEQSGADAESSVTDVMRRMQQQKTLLSQKDGRAMRRALVAVAVAAMTGMSTAS
jgi:hypothetical protein